MYAFLKLFPMLEMFFQHRVGQFFYKNHFYLFNLNLNPCNILGALPDAKAGLSPKLDVDGGIKSPSAEWDSGRW